MPITHRIPSILAVASVLGLLGAASLPVAAAANDPIQDQRPRRAPPAQQEVPEPGSLALVGLGLGLAGLILRRKPKG